MTGKIKSSKPLENSELFAYKNPELPVEDRVADLLSRMTIEEKVAQLMGLWNDGIEDFGEEVLNDPAKMKEIFGNG